MWKFIVDVVHDFVSSLQPDVSRGFLHVSNVFLFFTRRRLNRYGGSVRVCTPMVEEHTWTDPRYMHVRHWQKIVISTAIIAKPEYIQNTKSNNTFIGNPLSVSPLCPNERRCVRFDFYILITYPMGSRTIMKTSWLAKTTLTTFVDHLLYRAE